MSFLIKICGVTTVSDALACAKAGADAIGINLWPGSPRGMDLAAARLIAEALEREHPPVRRVGVFVNGEPAEIQAALDSGLCHIVQLHGDEAPALGAGLRGLVWKGLRLRARDDLDLLDTYTLRDYPLVVIDAPSPAYGGSGQRIDEEIGARAAALRPVLLAGGLDPENVFDAALRVRPAGVDVASGVEERPGRKDLGRVVAFLAAARAAAASIERSSG